MTDISDEEAAEALWTSSETGKAAIRAAWDRAEALDADSRRWASVRLLDEADMGSVVYAAFRAAERARRP